MTIQKQGYSYSSRKIFDGDKSNKPRKLNVKNY